MITHNIKDGKTKKPGYMLKPNIHHNFPSNLARKTEMLKQQISS